jgi:hypothetical protein
VASRCRRVEVGADDEDRHGDVDRRDDRQVGGRRHVLAAPHLGHVAEVVAQDGEEGGGDRLVVDGDLALVRAHEVVM